jgi:predicted HTH transcriptional regulator
MNTKGGTLGVGISDEGELLGVQPDLDFKKQDVDGYQNWLSTLLMGAVGQSNVASLVKVRFEDVEGKTICLIDVLPASKPVYANTVKGKDTFFVRVGNTTRVLTGPEMVDYIADRYGI